MPDTADDLSYDESVALLAQLTEEYEQLKIEIEAKKANNAEMKKTLLALRSKNEALDKELSKLRDDEATYRELTRINKEKLQFIESRIELVQEEVLSYQIDTLNKIHQLFMAKGISLSVFQQVYAKTLNFFQKLNTAEPADFEKIKEEALIELRGLTPSELECEGQVSDSHESAC